MKSSPVTQNKRAVKVSSKNKKVIKEVASPRKNVTQHNSSIAKNVATKNPKQGKVPLLKKIKRSTKQGVKTMLLSPVFHGAFKIVLGLLIGTSALYGSYHAIGQSFKNEVVVSQSEIVARVGKLTLLPQETPSEVVRVQDPEVLKKQNSFYENVKEGDYILMYSNVAVIYDLRNNSIVALKRTDSR